MSLTIVWFRRDLRLADNPALSRAAERGDPLLPVYLQDWEKGSPWSPGVAARWWLTASLRHLSADLDARGVALQFLSGDPVRVLPDLAVALGAGEVAWNTLLEPYALDLDRRVRVALETLGVRARTFSGPVLFEPEEHLSRAGRPFVQFGAFWRSCLALPGPRSPLVPPRTLVSVPEDLLAQAVARDPGPWRTVASAPGLQQAVAPAPGLRRQPDPVSGRVAWQPGEEGARRRLDRFLKEALVDYATARDYPAVEGVSRLSPYLHFGEITPQQVWHTIREVSGRPARQPRAGTIPRRDLAATQEGADAFLRQLGWREFGHYLLYHFPTIATQPFRPEFSRFPWHEDPEGLAAWKEGLTGFPLVDAGMRQLVSEGWMHNRVRMVVASFLTKDLLLPWQQGAAWFWEHLVDADLANNSLGWQWTAGSGPDAAPYFRVYNPDLQVRRFDPDHTYLDRWLPPGRTSPPAPIIDHGVARLRALEAFRMTRV